MDELGFYYCMSTGSSPEFSNVTKLQIKESPKPECQNHNVVNLERNQTAVNVPEQNRSSWAIIILISGALPGLLIFVIIVWNLFFSRVQASRPHSYHLVYTLNILKKALSLEGGLVSMARPGGIDDNTAVDSP
ncbi:hypothetical protein DNTS_024366 [Danionella cerebrum]|uniref:Uncharacterized protein n=1 Tax=Danionella cerebrum TaxID=2873325 RepID=A0A553QSH8_9TELE|nr:hypothetical protein DNTS_024366 [Danionella translucida]